jgi:N-methylhydantoinase A/oxoprolinase/acetone carboxylase beta subunit
MRIGVDVGGTNTDAALIRNREVLATVKLPTTADVSHGVRAAIAAVISEAAVRADAIHAVMIGTTHFTNAFIQASGLARIGSLRIGFPATRGIPPFSGWPQRLADAIRGDVSLVAGGFEFDGRMISPLDEAAIADAARVFRDKGLGEIAVTGVFSQLNPDHEKRAAEILRQEIPGAGITLSSDLGRIGLLERENAAIMNAALRPLARRIAKAFGDALRDLGINAPFFVSQNDGTLMTAEHMARFPVLTFAAGPTNSLRGAAFLSGYRDAVVADIGGTTTDIGVLVAGFPRQSSLHVDIGGVRTNFRMPDILSVGLGGGSRVRDRGGEASVGPESVGFDLLKEARVFGGSTLTASDIAVAAGQTEMGDPTLVRDLPADIVSHALDSIHAMIEDGIDRVKTAATPIPLILVGGGSILVGRDLAGVSDMLRPVHAEVANAVGAAIGQVSGEVDRVYSFSTQDRGEALIDASERARQMAVAAGAAEDSIEIVELEDIPLQYLPGGATRVICRAVGDLEALRDRVDG